jgi:hypothetical protein
MEGGWGISIGTARFGRLPRNPICIWPNRVREDLYYRRGRRGSRRISATSPKAYLLEACILIRLKGMASFTLLHSDL